MLSPWPTCKKEAGNVIDKLKESVEHIIICIDTKDHQSTMSAIAQFTLLFEVFILQNKEYIFDREVANLNRRLAQMMRCMEHSDLQGLKEIINLGFKAFLDDWDFDNLLIN